LSLQYSIKYYAVGLAQAESWQHISAHFFAQAEGCKKIITYKKIAAAGITCTGWILYEK